MNDRKPSFELSVNIDRTHKLIMKYQCLNVIQYYVANKLSNNISKRKDSMERMLFSGANTFSLKKFIFNFIYHNISQP